jgi:signal transduction histidine kinase
MDSSLRREYSGLGLGLTVARRLADFLGGNLQIKSQRERGTRVTLNIPYHPAPQKHVVSRRMV